MGKVKYIREIEEFFKKSLVVDINSLKNFIRKHRGNEKYIYLLISNMLKRGKIKRLTKGYYTIHEDPTLAVFCFKPAYIGLQNALSIYDLWEQETIPVIITTRKVRQGLRNIFGNNVLIKRISKKYFFGFEYIEYSSFFIPISDVEKTFIDMIYFKQKLDKELIKNFKKRINKKKLEGYLNRYPIKQHKRLIYLMKKQNIL